MESMKMSLCPMCDHCKSSPFPVIGVGSARGGVTTIR